MKFLKPSFSILSQFYKDREKNLKLLISRHLKQQAENLSPGDTAAVTRIVYGVVRREQQIEFILQQVSSRKLKKIHANLLVLLKIGTYLLLFSDSYPSYAVVNEVVAQAGGKTRGFVNALLRNIAKQEATLKESLQAVEKLEIKHCMPTEVIANLKTISSNLDQDLHYLNTEPVFHLRINCNEITNSETSALLKEKGIEAKQLKEFQSFEVKEAGLLIPELAGSKRFYFQNTASQLIAMIASRFARETILDCCAAPGTKSITMALSNPKLKIYANDNHPGRVRLIHHFSRRYGLHENIKTCVSDITTMPFKEKFDFILIDAPCSSSGTLRKNPDLKLKINETFIQRNAQTQQDILNEILRTCADSPKKPHILYSVCSFMQQETEGVMELIMNNPMGKRFKTIDLIPILDEFGFNYKKAKYGVYLLPDRRLNNDLFYLSLINP